MRPTAVLFDFDGTLAPNLDLPDMRRQVLELTQTLDVPSSVYEDKYIVEIIDAACTWLNKHRCNGIALACRRDRAQHTAHATADRRSGRGADPG